MGKSVLTVDARFSVCISLTPSHLMMPGLELSSFGALCISRGWDRQLPALRLCNQYYSPTLFFPSIHNTISWLLLPHRIHTKASIQIILITNLWNLSPCIGARLVWVSLTSINFNIYYRLIIIFTKHYLWIHAVTIKLLRNNKRDGEW